MHFIVFFWHRCARLLFVVVFENVVTITAIALKLAIPDISAELKYKIRREAYITKEIIIRYGINDWDLV